MNFEGGQWAPRLWMRTWAGAFNFISGAGGRASPSSDAQSPLGVVFTSVSCTSKCWEVDFVLLAITQLELPLTLVYIVNDGTYGDSAQKFCLV